MRGIICEGYKDAYSLLQLMRVLEPELISHTSIFTVQNGANSINTNGCLQKINWRMFEAVSLIMDNDEAGDKATKVAVELFPIMDDLRKRYISGYNDIEERFRKEYKEQIDIDRAIAADWLKEYECI